MSCKKISNSVLEDGEYSSVLSAGNCTVFDESSNAFSYRINGLAPDQNLDFFVGNSYFNQNWVEAPASTTARDGIGPLFNSRSCAGCHFKDGRGQPFSGLGILFRLSINDGSSTPSPEPIYGFQFQDYGISTVQSEGSISISYLEESGQYADETFYSLRKPLYTVTGLNYGAIDPNVMISPRIGQQMIGLGLLELIRESDILAKEDQFDSDGNGISGKANYVWDPSQNATVLGRFGWKANAGSIPAQVAGALNGDLGVKSYIEPNDNHSSLQPGLNGLPDGGTVEIDDDDFDKLVLYSRTLAVPVRRDLNNYDVKYGDQLFTSIGCANCHTPQHKTGTNGNITPLKNVVIHAYTDLLLHDMGPGLADNRPDGLANGQEWRTQPLWGLGLIQTVNGHSYLLHDGRARSIEEAILWHGGEAEVIKNKYKDLNAYERKSILDFLNSL